MMREISLPKITKSAGVYTLGGGIPKFVFDLTTEYGATRRKLIVTPTSRVWGLMNEKGIPNGSSEGEVVYAWHMLKRQGRASWFPAIFSTAHEGGRNILLLAFQEIKFLRALMGDQNV